VKVDIVQDAPPPPVQPPMFDKINAVNVLVIDVGGSHVKLTATGRRGRSRFASGRGMTPDAFVAQVLRLTARWTYDVISFGYPGGIGPHGPTADPGNLGPGWVGYDFEAAFGRPVRMVNDAAMQALGGYDGGRMLFLGLGTGLGSAFVADRVIVPLELGTLPYKRGEMLGDRLGKRGLKEYGIKSWRMAVAQTAEMLQRAFMTDYVVLGGGNASKMRALPPYARRGGNEDAFEGGVRLWEEHIEGHDGPPSNTWRVVR
jgi:polyphosphate glucokinase